MKKLFVLAVSILAASVTVNAAASAADMATKAPIEIVGPSWTGFYVSGGLGYGAWTADTTTVDQNTGQCVGCVVQVQGGKGWLGRVGIGYDYQFTSHLVAGLFGDYDFASLKGTIQDQNAGFTGQIKQNSAWALGARVGWLITPGVLGYANGGYTSARFSSAHMVITNVSQATNFSTPAETTHGWFLGGGLEVAVMPHLFWRNEYRYAAYASRTLPDTDGVAPVNSITFKPTVQTFTTQLVYKFNWLR